MRNSPEGMIWQAYNVDDEEEETILTQNAKTNGFIVSREVAGYTEETCPDWRESEAWAKSLKYFRDPSSKPENKVYSILKNIRRDGPYWLGGYKDWLVACFSLRSEEDLKGFTPIACYSELIKEGCVQWMVLTKDDCYYVDKHDFRVSGRDYGVFPVKHSELLYPSHIFDWLYKELDIPILKG